jgi:hypothetical protein
MSNVEIDGGEADDSDKAPEQEAVQTEEEASNLVVEQENTV